ncbi:MAG: hypothetical protein ACFCBV_05915 [Phycisphaerales bacterium]
MQPKLGESPGDLGAGYEIFIVEDWIAINTPTRQTRFGPISDQLQIPYSEVLVCTKDENFFFIAHTRPSAANATFYRIDLNAGTHAKLTLPNNHGQILGHIYSVSPSAREHDPFMLTGGGQFMIGAAHVVGYTCAGFSALFVVAIVVTAVVLRKRRKQVQ